MAINWANQLVGMRDLLVACLDTDLFVDAVSTVQFWQREHCSVRILVIISWAERTLFCSDTSYHLMGRENTVLFAY